MKKQCIKTFKQIYKDLVTKEEKSFSYKVGVVLDTQDYTYRIMNLDSLSIWKNYKFKTFKKAEEFLTNHPHNIENQKKEVK
jgi:hypothetical protein